MREIKFRAWNTYTKSWSYFNGPFNKIPTKETSSFPQYESIPVSVIDNKTISQYTGLKDKNGKEIYEFDYLAFGEKEWVIKVEFLDGMFGAYEPMSAHWQDLAYWVYGAEIDCTVIGNVFENPELLEK